MLDVRPASIALCLAVLFAAEGCGLAILGSKKEFDIYNKEPLAKTASFDLGCPAPELSFTPLGTESDGYLKVGVTGCSKKATYVMLNGNWLKDSETNPSK